jgi:PQQ-dependent catabolism-associated CXXCW motif protein
LEFHLKPGHNTFDMRRSSNGESMSLSEEKVRSISCAISNAAQPAVPEARQAPSDQQAALTPQAAAPAAGTLPNGNGIGTAPPIYDREDEDFGVTPMPRIYNGQHGSFEAPTPTTIAGAETITTWALKAMIAAGHPPPVLIDALDGNLTASLPHAIWLPRAGYGGVLGDELQAKLGAALTKLTHGDKAQPIVFFCRSRTCWLSHNAVLRAVALGYSKVYWYRGGRQAWIAAGLDLERIAARPLF